MISADHAPHAQSADKHTTHAVSSDLQESTESVQTRSLRLREAFLDTKEVVLASKSRILQRRVARELELSGIDREKEALHTRLGKMVEESEAKAISNTSNVKTALLLQLEHVRERGKLIAAAQLLDAEQVQVICRSPQVALSSVFVIVGPC
jgi:hypothetical protein